MSLDVHSRYKCKFLAARPITLSCLLLCKGRKIIVVTSGSVVQGFSGNIGRDLRTVPGTKDSESQNNTSEPAQHAPGLCLISQQTIWLGSPMTNFKCHDLQTGKMAHWQGTCCQAGRPEFDPGT